MAGSTVSAANIRLGADITGLLSNLRTASQAINQHAAGVNLGLTNAYRQADAASRQFRTGIGRLGSELQDIGKKMSLFGTLPALFATGAAYKGFADLQKLKIGLNQYGESLETVKQLAKLPNIGIEGAAKSLIQLRAVGIESDLAQKAIKAFGNAITAAGKSSEDLNPALTNVVQFLSTGVVSAADVKELANRIPQTRKALMDAFGTASGEELTKIGPQKVVEGLIAELSKIPPVAGGAGMAMEKFGDSSQFATATIGESIDKAFNLTQTISSLADKLGDITDGFAELNPNTQKFSLTLAALAVAVPLVVTALGAAVSAGAALAIGLGVAGATVAIVAAGVVVAGALIITYWDDIKEKLTDVGLWSTLVGLTESALGTITGAFKTIGSLLSGDWAGLWTGLKNTVASAINFLNTLMFGLVKQVGLIVASITGLLLMPELGNWIREKSLGLDSILKKLNIAQSTTPGQSVVNTNDYGKQFAEDDKQTKTWQDQQESLKKFKPATNIASMSIKELGEKLTGLKDAYESLKPNEAGYAQKKSDIVKQVRLVTNMIDTQSKSLKDSSKHVKEATGEYVKLSEAQFQMWSIDLSMKYAEEQKSLKDKIKSYKELIGVVSGLNVEILKSVGMKFGGPDLGKLSGPASTMSDTIEKIKKGNSQSTSGTRWAAALDMNDFFGGKVPLGEIKAYFDSIPKIAGESAKAYGEKLGLFASATMTLTGSIQDAVKKMITDISISLGEGLGDALSGLEDPFKDLGKTILSAFSNLLTDVGKALITYGATIIAAKIAMKSMNAYVAIGAGILAVAAGKVLKNKMSSSSSPRFAKGGFAYGEMNAIVGDNPNARFDPEMIAPYSKVHNSIVQSVKDSGGGGNVFIPEMKLRGEDIYISFTRTQKRNKAIQL